MAEVSPDTGQAPRDVVAALSRRSTRLRMLAEEVIEDRVTNRHIQGMMHAMSTRQRKISPVSVREATGASVGVVSRTPYRFLAFSALMATLSDYPSWYHPSEMPDFQSLRRVEYAA